MHGDGLAIAGRRAFRQAAGNFHVLELDEEMTWANKAHWVNSCFESIVIEESDSIDAVKELDQAEHKIKASSVSCKG